MSILETTCSIALLGLLSIVAFQAFDWGSNLFRVSNGRVELQAELRRINTALRKDFLLSSFTSLGTHRSEYNVPEHPPDPAPAIKVVREALCFASMLDCHKSANYDPATGQSKFDCWTIYCPYTDPANESRCSLYRYRVEEHPSELSQLKMDLMGGYQPFETGTSYLWPNPQKMVFNSLHHYSDRIRSLEVAVNLGDQTLVAKITLQGDAGHLQGGKKRTSEVVSTEVLLKAENTWPKL